MGYVRAEDGEIEAGGAPARFELKAMICRGEYDSRRAARRRTTHVFVHGGVERIIVLVQVDEAFVRRARATRTRARERKSSACGQPGTGECPAPRM
jgi:hypothetical protein